MHKILWKTTFAYRFDEFIHSLVVSFTNGSHSFIWFDVVGPQVVRFLHGLLDWRVVQTNKPVMNDGANINSSSTLNILDLSVYSRQEFGWGFYNFWPETKPRNQFPSFLNPHHSDSYLICYPLITTHLISFMITICSLQLLQATSRPLDNSPNRQIMRSQLTQSSTRLRPDSTKPEFGRRNRCVNGRMCF